MASVDVHLTPSGARAEDLPPPSDGVGAVDEPTALMFAAERGAIKSIQAWQQRGGNLDSLIVHQVRMAALSFPNPLAPEALFLRALTRLSTRLLTTAPPFLPPEPCCALPCAGGWLLHAPAACGLYGPRYCHSHAARGGDGP